MKPYYQDEKSRIVIYHCDNRELLADLPKHDLILTDPQYGIDHPTNYAKRGRDALAQCRDYAKVHGDAEPFDPAAWIGHGPAILWGANHYASRLPDSDSWLVWDKLRPDDLDQSTCELAWSNCTKGVRRFSYLWDGMRKQIRGAHEEKLVHPTQKPVSLMLWCLTMKWTVYFDIILDPFMGSGPVGRACKDLGKAYIGCDIVESYCEEAARRLSQEVLKL